MFGVLELVFVDWFVFIGDIVFVVILKKLFRVCVWNWFMGRFEVCWMFLVFYIFVFKLKLIKVNMMVLFIEIGIMFGRVYCLWEFKCYGVN